MVPIKRRCKYYDTCERRCKYYDTCELADPTSVTCTQDGGGDYCGAFRGACEVGKERKGRDVK